MSAMETDTVERTEEQQQEQEQQNTTVDLQEPSEDTTKSLVPAGEQGVATTTNTDENATTEDGSAPKKRLVKKKKRRPARPQVDPTNFTPGQLPPQTGTIFNIWYNKWSGGDREDKYISKNPAQGRCNIARDSGYTRADTIPGSYFCLFFARGLCPHGQNCEYLHRLPVVTDIFNPNVDCFGRDKHADYRDDMGGVGSFLRQNRTLYIGRIHVSDDIEEIVARHFAEWGQIERIRVLNSRGVGFVTYSNEANAQFAKEAMAHQSLDHNEILNVRWATIDPNPMAQSREKRRIEEQAAEAIRKALPKEYVDEIEGRSAPGGGKKRRLDGGFDDLEGYVMPEDVWYAREKASLQSGEQQGMIEGIPGQYGQQQQEEETGLLSSGALQALEKLKARGAQSSVGSVKVVNPVKPAQSTGLALVGYGSDSDED
ncbi:hypothetical protein BJ508DRAFT_360188 [Ascobolus immersus RN42]|uniref:Pre-mRNA-splicing factor CWC2 n=1 Tax=Ascobolus immersus RN42 TaxID=1160509 RepID=A0A3N4ICL4_ASCIM|nr:hypothetical protein BJ508DRAFT_360188 [Ascobolus immersus RN42]